jgi:LCP family protein required for cell wall assembly
LILLVLGGVGAASTLTYLNSQLSEVNKLSTPPPELSSERLGGEERLTIDTSAAQEAVRNAETTDNDDDAFEDNNVAAAQSSGGVGTPDAFVNTPSSNGSVTILLMGVDARPGEPIDVEVRPDTLAVLHLNGETGSCRMLSVPRDTRTELPGYGLSKVNHALAIGGIPYQALVTQNLLGVEIDHYGLIDFSGIEGLVDAVGGVTVDNGQAFTVGSTTFNAGPINLDGEEALVYARYRGGADGDFGRIDRQQQIVRALISQTSGMDVVTGAYRLLGAVEGHVKTDLAVTDMITLANSFRASCNEATLEVDTLDGIVATYPDPLLNMDLSYVVVDPAEIERKVAWLLESP